MAKQTFYTKEEVVNYIRGKALNSIKGYIDCTQITEATESLLINRIIGIMEILDAVEEDLQFDDDAKYDPNL